jgi:signal transduction histidine kinase
VWIRFEVADVRILLSLMLASFHLVLSQNGCGITPTDQKKLFKPFHQIAPGALQHGKGTGLGLTICRELHASGTYCSEVGVTSTGVPGQGAIFYAGGTVRS